MAAGRRPSVARRIWRISALTRSRRCRGDRRTPRQSDRWRQHRRRQKSAPLRALRWFRHRPAGSADQASPPDGPRPRTGRRTAAWFATAIASTIDRKPMRLSVRLRSLLASHQDIDGLGRRAAAVEHGGHYDRQLDAWRAPSASAAPCAHPFGDHAHAGEDSCNDWPRPSSRPTWRFRLRSPVEVNTRSPRPLKPASVSRCPPSASASREISPGSSRDKGAMALCQAEPFDYSRCNGDDVLHRPANLNTGTSSLT